MNEPQWITTEATVTSCRYQFRAGSALAFGVRLGEKFRIAFDYYANGQLYSDEFQSPIAIPQNERLTLRYNPLHPEQNSLGQGPLMKNARLTLPAIVALAALTLLWLMTLRACR